MAFDATRDGDMNYFCLGKVDMTSATTPKLIFDYYAVPGTTMSITTEINMAFNGEYKTCDPINFKTIGGEAGWREAIVDLYDFKSLPYISVCFLGVGGTSHPLRIDNVRIMNSDKTPNLGFSGISEISGDAAVGGVYCDLNGMVVGKPQKGLIYILRTSDGKAKKVVY